MNVPLTECDAAMTDRIGSALADRSPVLYPQTDTEIQRAFEALGSIDP